MSEPVTDTPPPDPRRRRRPGHARIGSASWFVPALATALVLGVLARPSAMVVVPAEFSEMVAASQVVVHGLVAEVRAYETSGRRTIETLVTVRVSEAYKGRPGPTVYLRVPGGQVGRYRRMMVGAPVFTQGDEVVLFLTGRAPAVPMPFGLTQGVYRVVRSAEGRASVTPFPTAGPGRVVRGDPARRPLDLAAFAAQVRATQELPQ